MTSKWRGQCDLFLYRSISLELVDSNFVPKVTLFLKLMRKGDFTRTLNDCKVFNDGWMMDGLFSLMK